MSGPGSIPFDGLIDDVKIWRPNPNRITRDFLIRILDGGVSDCWSEWGEVPGRADRPRRPRCRMRRHTFHACDQVQAAIGPVVLHSAATRLAWEQTIADYQRLWAQGYVAAIGPVLTRLLDTLARRGRPARPGRGYSGADRQRVLPGAASTVAIAGLRSAVHPDALWSRELAPWRHLW